MKYLHIVSFLLLVVGGLNWGLMGLGGFMGSDWNVVHMILGAWPQVEWVVYILVGLSALFLMLDHKRSCKMCMAGGAKPMA
ncbi:MAG: DUF378 domain-containing protein [Patescibacteria group bacterium]